MGEIVHLGIRQEGTKIVVSSRIVAQNFDKEHKHVMRDIRNIIEQFNQSNLGPVENYFIESTYIDAKGETRPEYLLTKDGFTLLTMGWTGEKAMRFKIAYINEFNRMEQELNRRMPYKIPQTYAEALRLAADLAEENEKLRPKAEMHDMFLSAKNSQPVGVVAKALGIGRNKLFELLRNEKILMSNNVPYQEFIDRGYFEVIEKPIAMGNVVINKAQTYVTPKGVDYIGRLLKEKRERECS